MNTLVGIKLSALLVVTRAVYQEAESFHWRTAGANYYADHLLFERIYKDIYGFLDPLAERLVGLTNDPNLVEPSRMARATALVLSKKPPVTDPAAFPQALLFCLKKLTSALAQALAALEEAGALTPGLENLFQSMADALESHVYLMQQRAA